MTKQKRILVTGAGGFIGHHLVKRLKKDGHWVRGADPKLPEYETSAAEEMKFSTCARKKTAYWPRAEELMRSTISPPTWAALAILLPISLPSAAITF